MKEPIAQGPVDVTVGPVAWAVFAENGNIQIWSSASEPVRELAEREGVELVPLYAIPEGWKLVPVKPTQRMLDATSAPGCAAADWSNMLRAAPVTPA